MASIPAGLAKSKTQSSSILGKQATLMDTFNAVRQRLATDPRAFSDVAVIRSVRGLLDNPAFHTMTVETVRRSQPSIANAVLLYYQRTRQEVPGV